ncbi:hypothetical protein Taro_041872 [Colocasia esculenta]|uniref:Uncharacterized protein n=1 Tax=Colocasia esculenta TaxID=4460 RepID=A0A843WX27_COLES|nr:hypothetical protein [Colocasia esculenta]
MNTTICLLQRFLYRSQRFSYYVIESLCTKKTLSCTSCSSWFLLSEGRPGDIQGGGVPFVWKEDLVGTKVLFLFGL